MRSSRRAKRWWGRKDSNLRSHKTADLQSAPFATRDTPPLDGSTIGPDLAGDRRRPWNMKPQQPGWGRDRARLSAKRWGKVNRGEQLKSPPKAPKLPYSGTHDTSEPMKDRKFNPKGPRGGSKPFNRPGKSAGRPARRDRNSDTDGPVILYGWHTVTMALANPQRQIRKLTLTENAATPSGGRKHRDPRRARDRPAAGDRPAAVARCRAPGPACRGRSPALARHRGLGAGRHRAGARSDHRSAQCRRHPALGGGVRGEGDRHHRPPQSGSDRRAGQSRLRRAGAGADGHRAEPRPRTDHAERASASRPSGWTAKAARTSPTSCCASRSRWFWARKARGCGN